MGRLRRDMIRVSHHLQSARRRRCRQTQTGRSSRDSRVACPNSRQTRHDATVAACLPVCLSVCFTESSDSGSQMKFVCVCVGGSGDDGGLSAPCNLFDTENSPRATQTFCWPSETSTFRSNKLDTTQIGSGYVCVRVCVRSCVVGATALRPALAVAQGQRAASDWQSSASA